MIELTPLQWFIVFIYWCLIGAGTSYYAQQRGRDPIRWFFIGALFGVFGFAVLFLLPDLTQEEESTPPPVVPIAEVHPLVETEWFYLDADRQQIGPIPFLELKQLYQDQTINDETYVWREEMPEWRKVSSIDDFY